ncbi:O-methylsterigmatocystin oxidoreductase [Pyrenophora seminiperda CCB06]|uniref:O-methylsterigmatocystin oxidoreductase n=1 Tax=Pyrenophora seminiperda CCB06 TaxID=1302712 RepID=A0A3M7M724_9PLEO|nr:O-methylsterigmatocystin oxidoreductase [Pyrenophora seminiperda CCB06]
MAIIDIIRTYTTALIYFTFKVAAFLAVLFLLLSITYLTVVPNILKDPRRRHLPPGPRGLPFVGSLFELSDTEAVRHKVQAWHRQYGDVFYTKIGATDYMWLSSPQAVKDLMDKRSSIYSSRPPSPLAQDVASAGRRQLFMPYGARWRSIRKHSHVLLNLGSSVKYQPIQDYESKVLLTHLLQEPDSFASINRRYAASVIMQVTYGQRIPSWDSPLIQRIYSVLERFTEMTAPGAWAIESCICTTGTVLNNFVLAMLLFPETQKMAQKELDRVVGADRLPGWEDEEKLPYLRAMMKEVLRWRPVDKAGMMHASSEDDWYRGWFMPKGSVVMLNWWAIHNDPSLHHSPSTFSPSRYLNRPLSSAHYMTSPDPAVRDHFSFGAGRRACPGVHVAERSMFINMARVLWGFNIRKKVGRDGKEVPVSDKMMPGFFSVPEPFEADIRPRSEEHVRVMREEKERAEREGLKD